MWRTRRRYSRRAFSQRPKNRRRGTWSDPDENDDDDHEADDPEEIGDQVESRTRGRFLEMEADEDNQEDDDHEDGSHRRRRGRQSKRKKAQAPDGKSQQKRTRTAFLGQPSASDLLGNAGLLGQMFQPSGLGLDVDKQSEQRKQRVFRCPERGCAFTSHQIRDVQEHDRQNHQDG